MRSGAAGTMVVRAAAWLLPRVPHLPSAPLGCSAASVAQSLRAAGRRGGAS